MELLLLLFLPVLFIAGCGAIGAVDEHRHLRDLASREAAVAHVLVTDLRTVPESVHAVAGTMVGGNVVITADLFKDRRAAFRNLIGGELRSYRTLLDRGRREARLRMLEEARQAGATLVVNVRFTTADVGQGVELICYGTAIRSDGAG